MIQTNWYVITGAPSSGKTTLINALSKSGFSIAPEIARDYIEKLLADHHTLDDIRHDTRQLQRGILATALRRERHLNKEALTFFDRGTTDSLGYFKFYNLDATHVSHACQHIRYKKIFYCHQLPMAYDSVRVEDTRTAQQIGEFIYQSYISLGYELIELPAVSVEERLKIILSHVEF